MPNTHLTTDETVKGTVTVAIPRTPTPTRPCGRGTNLATSGWAVDSPWCGEPGWSRQGGLADKMEGRTVNNLKGRFCAKTGGLLHVQDIMY